jgi:hypothetical protein
MIVAPTNDFVNDRFEERGPIPPNEGMAEAEQRLLDFVGSLILDVAQTHPRVNQSEIASWLARVAVGSK